jgi:hypothetical protein
LVGRVNVRQTAHVAGALDVVLAAQRVDTAAGHTHIAQEHLQVGQVHDIAHTHDMLGDAHCPENGHRFVERQDLSSLV